MAKEFAKKFYKSVRWLKARAVYIAKRKTIDGGLCEHCKEALGYIVDHKEELTPSNINDPSIALSEENFQYLCLKCHNKKTFLKYSAGEFDDDGQPRPPLYN